MPTVAGVDSSTQSTKVVVCDADSGEVLAEGRAPHPDGTECPPAAWWEALRTAGAGLLDGVDAIGVAGQQHGLVALDEAGEVVRPALLWNDTRSAAEADRLVEELGGPAEWARAVGSVPLASFTITKLAWLAEHEPENAARVATVMLPHDYLTWELTGRPERPVTDRGDASGTGYWSPSSGAYRDDLLALAFGRTPGLPLVLGPADAAGEAVGWKRGDSAGNGSSRESGAGSTASGSGEASGSGAESRSGRAALVSAGTGDNMAAALGLGLRPGDVVVSLGTSGTVFAVHDEPTADPSGQVAGFADATGRFLPLICTLNAARVIAATAHMIGAEVAELDRLALAAEPGAGGLVLLPYLDGERTPNLPDAAGSLHNLRRDAMTPQNLARATVEGMLCGLADGLDALVAQGIRVSRLLLVGGGARSSAVRDIAPSVFGVPVHVPPAGEYVARGAARQAAWALAGGVEAPGWAYGEMQTYDGVDEAARSRIREQYALARDALYARQP